MINRKIRLLFALLLAFQMIIPSSILAAAVGQFTSVVGDVAQTRAGVATKPAVKSTVESNDVIVTGDKSAASIYLIDDSAITVAAGSKLDVKELSIKDNTRKGLFALSMGKLTANVRKFVGGDNVFEVHTPNAIAGVRGTAFEVAFFMVPQMTTHITCTVGMLSVSHISATGTVISTTTIVAGQTAIVTATGIVVGAAAGAAGLAGAAAGTATTAGVTTGTIAIGAAAAAAAILTAVATTGGETTSTHHHSTTNHHGTTATHNH